MIKWVYGQRLTGYKTLTLLNVKLPIFKFYGFDLHIIKYGKGDFIPPHKDPVKFGKHHRVNFVIWKGRGGEFLCENYKKILGGRIIYFRPDLEEHAVSLCKNVRIVVSLGWLII